MTMRTIGKGTSGDDVSQWQTFLRGLEYNVVINGEFDDATETATIAFQGNVGLYADGLVGDDTYKAAIDAGFHVVLDDFDNEFGTKWPPQSINYITPAEREQLFGKFSYKSTPVAGMPEAITITDGWASRNIAVYEIPQLAGILGAPKNCKVEINKKAAPQIIKTFQDWEDAGLKDRVIAWAGCWAPRFIRGSTTTLSNHSWATAFDINAGQNGLGCTPALKGKLGCVRELVQIAASNGLFWGGWWGYSNSGSGRSDGMHFEVAYLIES
jgi:hypothetical protein